MHITRMAQIEVDKLVRIICLSISLVMAALFAFYLVASMGWGWSLWVYSVPAMPIAFSFYFGLRGKDGRESIISCLALLVVFVILIGLPRSARLLEIGEEPDFSDATEFDMISNNLTTFLLFLVPGIAIAYIEGGGMKNGLKKLGLKPENGIPASIGWGLLLIIITMTAVIIAGLFLELVSSSLGYDLPQDNPLGEKMAGSLLLVIIVPILAGVGEEIFFRGVLQRRFGIAVQTLVFGLAHTAYFTPQQVIMPMLMAIIWGYGYRFTKDLRAVIIAHWGYDFIALSLVYLMG
jgi:membrane protease YdiL (CAAX protease family)